MKDDKSKADRKDNLPGSDENYKLEVERRRKPYPENELPISCCCPHTIWLPPDLLKTLDSIQIMHEGAHNLRLVLVTRDS